MLSLSVLLAALVVITFAVSVGILRRLDWNRSNRHWGDVARARLVMGVPWGTIVVILFVLSIYLFVQDGITDWNRPVTIPYRAWSYFYPLGMLTAPFAHDSANHLTGNLVGTLLVAPIAEYAWGHYPRGRDSDTDSGWYHDPWIRALVIFPGAVIGIGLLTSVFALGPVIGFSGVVYAFAGFAIVRYPITTLVAITTARGATMTIYRALSNPILEVTVQASPPSAPSWATIAIQGHALGFFLGFLCAIAIFHRRGVRSNPLRLWIAVLLFGFAQSLWAIYWIRGGDTYVLYRGLGVVVVTALALLLTLTVVSSNRPLVPLSLRRRVAARGASPTTKRILELGLPLERDDPDRTRSRERIHDMVLGSGTGAALGTRLKRGYGSRMPADLRSSLLLATRRGTAVFAVVMVLAFLMGPAIPFNLFVVDGDSSVGNESITVEDYSVTYAEDVENELISVVDVEAFGEDTTVETSGVIVSSEKRNIWMDAVSDQRLAFSGRATIQLGGPGWRESVTAYRQGWSATGGDTAYQIWLGKGSEQPQHVFTSESAQADVRLAGSNVTVVPHEGAFFLAVEDDDTSVAVQIPTEDAVFEAGNLTFERDGNAIYAETEDTRVQVASRERYNS